MIHTTQIDTIGLQVDFTSSTEQYKFFLLINKYLKVDEIHISTNNFKTIIYGCKTIIGIIKMGMCLMKNPLDNNLINNHYITIRFAGLKRYNTKIDTISRSILISICALLNTYKIKFKLIELDIAIDINSKLDNVLVLCTKKSPKTEYYDLNQKQFYADTIYLENMKKKKFKKTVLRAYYYNKRLKERKSKNELGFDLTRFEVKLQTQYFKKYGFDVNVIKKALDRYHVMYFPNLVERKEVIDKYLSYKCVRKREIERMKLSNYRLMPNMDVVKDFLDEIQMVDIDYLSVSDLIYECNILIF